MAPNRGSASRLQPLEPLGGTRLRVWGAHQGPYHGVPPPGTVQATTALPRGGHRSDACPAEGASRQPSLHRWGGGSRASLDHPFWPWSRIRTPLQHATSIDSSMSAIIELVAAARAVFPRPATQRKILISRTEDANQRASVPTQVIHQTCRIIKFGFVVATVDVV